MKRCGALSDRFRRDDKGTGMVPGGLGFLVLEDKVNSIVIWKRRDDLC